MEDTYYIKASDEKMVKSPGTVVEPLHNIVTTTALSGKLQVDL